MHKADLESISALAVQRAAHLMFRYVHELRYQPTFVMQATVTNARITRRQCRQVEETASGRLDLELPRFCIGAGSVDLVSLMPIYRAIFIWNALPTELHTYTSLANFKQRLKESSVWSKFKSHIRTLTSHIALNILQLF